MTVLRQDAIRMVENMSENKLPYLIQILQGMEGLFSQDEVSGNQAAFETLERLRRPIPDLDEKKELEEYRKEKYGL